MAAVHKTSGAETLARERTAVQGVFGYLINNFFNRSMPDLWANGAVPLRRRFFSCVAVDVDGTYLSICISDDAVARRGQSLR